MTRNPQAPPRLWIAATLLATAFACADGPAVPERPNVLLITIDTLRADHLHSYGFPLEVSPNLDVLASQGVVFERAIAAASATAPSHASIMTSRYPREHSVGHGNGTTQLVRDPTLAEFYANAGYQTAAFVGNLVLEKRTGFDRGFAHYDDEFDQREPNRESYERVAEKTTRRALAWIEAAGDEPWFLWVHYQDPHGPYSPPEAHLGRFQVEAPEGEAPLPDSEGKTDRGGIPDYQKLEGLTRLSEYRSRYVEEVFYADEWIGRLLEVVDAGPQAPIVLVTADHGEAMGENDRYFVHFWTTTPENAHVPMILRAPGITPERRSRIVSHVDILPTLLELSGIQALEHARGLALGPFLRNRKPLPERVVFSDAGHELTAYRSRWFVRVRRTQPGDASPEADAPAPQPIGYAWRNSGKWMPLADDVDLASEVRAYMALENTTSPAPFLDADTARRLRALGYAPE